MLYRVGGREDAGVDLVGTWHVPTTTARRHRHRHRILRVFVQCKALKAKLGPNLVRELEGTFTTFFSPSHRNQGEEDGKKDEVGILVSTREATKGVRDAMTSSVYPLFWMMVDREGVLHQALWNARVDELGLGLLGVESRYNTQSPTEKSIVLTWDGHDLPGMDQVEDAMAAREAEWLASWKDNNSGSTLLSDAGKSELLDIIQESFPNAQLEEGGRSSGLTDDDRKRILHELNGRLNRTWP